MTEYIFNDEIVDNDNLPEDIKPYSDGRPIYKVTGELIRCKDCKYLDVINSNTVYARCEKHGIEFLPFEDDTRECFCSWAERKEG